MLACISKKVVKLFALFGILIGSFFVTGMNLHAHAQTVEAATTAVPQISPLYARMDLDASEITSVNDLVARVFLQSVSSEPFTVNMEFSVHDKDGVEILTQSDSIEVQQEALFVKRFDGSSNLPEGAYALHVMIDYDSSEKSLESPFAVEAPGRSSPWLIYALIVNTAAFCVALMLKAVQTGGELRFRERRQADNE